MKREHFAVVVIGLIIFGYVLDILSGPIVIPLRNPFGFLSGQLLSSYPFTAVSVFAKAIAITIGLPLILSFLKQNILKAVLIFISGALMELYSIQQLATGQRMVSVQWALAFSFAGIGLLLPSIFYFIKGFITPLISPTTNMADKEFFSEKPTLR